MKKWIRTMAAALALLTAGCAAPARGETARLLAANVGKADALLLCVDDYAALIDTGNAYSMGRVRAAMRAMGVDALDAVFITHTDDDHTGGLNWLAASDIPVGAWYGSGYYTGVKEGKHPLTKAAEARGEAAQWLTRGDEIALGNTGATLKVLAPFTLFEDKDDNNSLVMMLETSQGRMLLTGDMELPQEAALLQQGDDLRCAVLKVANHGDDDTTSAAFARAAAAQAALISTDSYEKPGTPDPGVVSRLAAAGSAVYVTQDAGLGLLAELNGGAATVTALNIDAAETPGVFILNVEPGDDLITLENAGSVDVDLTGWSLYSVRGNELYAFPDGVRLPVGATLTVGTYSSDSGDYDLLWEDKKVVHKSKSDTIYLYDGWGRFVDCVDNGY